MSRVYCLECGYNNPESARFCAKCGAALVVPEEGEQTETFAIGDLGESLETLDDLGLHGADGDRWRLDDQGSLNGTFVNRERVDSAALSDGDEIQIGKYRLTYLHR
jgi:hypothetical protein